MLSIHRILVATDFSDTAQAAVDAAVELAGALDAELVVLHVVIPPSVAYPGPFMSLVELQAGIERAATAGVASTVSAIGSRVARVKGIVRTGTPWREIADTAKTIGADLLVLGTHGRTGFAHVLLGSVAEKVVRVAPCPVLTVRGPAFGGLGTATATTTSATDPSVVRTEGAQS